MSYHGQCKCGQIHFEARGEPYFTQYCHCNKCREVSADSQNEQDKVGYAYTAAWATKNFEITEGEDQLEKIIRFHSMLFRCNHCKSLIYGMAIDPKLQGGIGINMNNFHFSDGIPNNFSAIRHVYYPNRIVDFDDQLPKFVDAPIEQFGTGQLFE